MVKLYVCYGTFGLPDLVGGHPCGRAHAALKEAGYEPEVVRSYGWGLLPDVFNRTSGRREAKELTGKNWVPVLVTDSGEAISGSESIITWAKEHPASARSV